MLVVLEPLETVFLLTYVIRGLLFHYIMGVTFDDLSKFGMQSL
jgi:hypothetical protein